MTYANARPTFSLFFLFLFLFFFLYGSFEIKFAISNKNLTTEPEISFSKLDIFPHRVS